MTDEETPVEPIVRKKDADEPEAPTPVDFADDGEEAVVAPAAAAAAPATPAPVPTGRRVVDMATHNPQLVRPPAAAPPEAILQERDERPAAAAAEPVGVRVQAGSLEDFEALLAEGGSAPSGARPEVGDRVEGTVTSVGQKWAYIDLGAGSEGVARTADFIDRNGDQELVAGLSRAFFVVSTSDGTVTLGDQLSTREAVMDTIETAAESGVPLSGRVASKNKGGFEIDLGGAMAFCPISQIELAFTEDPDQHIGRSYQFRVMEVRDGGRSIVVSRAELLREAQAQAEQQMLATLEEGMTLDGTITRLADFGAFVDIGGVEGLIHVSELGFSRVEHPSELVKQGERVRVKVLKIEQSDRGLRIGLSMKETMEDPWEAAMGVIFAGAKLTGTVNRLEAFGAFVEVAPNVEGLVHVSEMSWEKHVKRPSDIVSVGQVVSVEVLDVDLIRHRIALSLKESAGDPWNTASEAYVPGQEVSGSVENIEDFGAFINLGGGITALLPRSEMGLSGSATPHAMFTRGDSVSARVLSVEPARRRLSLTLKSAEDVADTVNEGPRTYADGGSTGLGTLGDLLKDRFK